MNWLKHYWPLVAALVVVLVAWAIAGAGLMRDAQNADNDPELTEIRGREQP